MTTENSQSLSLDKRVAEALAEDCPGFWLRGLIRELNAERWQLMNDVDQYVKITTELQVEIDVLRKDIEQLHEKLDHLEYQYNP